MKFQYRHTMLACYGGYITQAIINNLAPLFFVIFQQDYGLSFEQVGRLILLNFATQLIVDLIAARYADRWGYRLSVVMAHAFAGGGLVLLSVLPRMMSPYIGLSIAVVVYAIGGGLIEVLISPIVDSLPGDAKASAMSLLHSFYCWGQVLTVLVSTLLLMALGNAKWFVLPLLWAVIPFANLLFFTRVPLMPGVEEARRTPLRQLFRAPVFLLAMVLMVCAGASELAMSQWSSLFAEKGLGVPKMIGDLLGPCLFAVLMGIGRTLFGFFGERLDLRRALCGCAVLCICCYLVTALAPSPLVSLLSCAVCGFSVSLMWPGTFSLTSARYPTGGTAMFGILALMGDVGCSLGPWITGLVSDGVQKAPSLAAQAAASGLSPDQLGLKAGLLTAAIFPLLMVLATLVLGRLGHKNKT